jgi:membrane protease YdiL (CAAX protease family)
MIANSHASLRLFMYGVITLLCVLLGMGLAQVLVPALSGISVAEATADPTLSHPGSLQAIRIFQLIISISWFLLTPLIYSLLVYKQKAAGFLQFNAVQPSKLYFTGIILLLASIPFVGWLQQINTGLDLGTMAKQAEDQATNLTKRFLQMPTVGDFIFNLVMVAIIPALGEELYFRGAMQQIFREWLGKPWPAIIITAAIFSAVHGQFLTFLPRFFLGILLGFVFERSGSIWLPILLHFINNGMQVVLVYLFQRGIISMNLMDDPGRMPLWAGISSALVTFALFHLFYRQSSWFKPAINQPDNGERMDPDL